MKKTYLKSLYRDILKSLNRFLAILSIVALGVGFLAGLMATTPDMQKSADVYFDNNNFMDLRIISTLGLSENDIEQLENLECVETIMPSYSYDIMMNGSNNETYVTRLHSIPEYNILDINKGKLIEGRFPTNQNEILIEKRKDFNTDLKINDKIFVSDDNKETNVIINKEFTVVGFIESSYYISSERESSTVGNGTINLIGYIPENCFILNAYTDAYLTIDNAKELNTFSKNYDELIDTSKNKIELLSDTLKNERFDEIKSDAQGKINSIEYPKWYILDRHTNTGFESFNINTEKVESIAKVFPIFFFLVATLVSLTTMTRMVEEERIQIGTLKALGYTNLSIAFKYVLYAALASILGSGIGLLVGLKLFPSVIWNAYDMMFRLPPLITEFNVKYATLSSITAIACTIIATLFACYNTLSENPAKLMLPRVPKAGKRIFLEYITPIWNRMKFSHKITARNLIRYKKRFFMTVIGVAGCTALLVTGFGLRDSIGDIILKQFGEIFKYNMVVSLKDAELIDKESTLSNTLNDKNIISNYTQISQNEVTVSFSHDDMKLTPTITIFKDSTQVERFINLRNRSNKKPIAFNDNSVIITEKAAEKLDIEIGDIIYVEDNDKNKATLRVTNITENYVYGYIYVSEKTYLDAFNKEPEYNTIIANTTESTKTIRDSISTKLLEVDIVNSVNFTDVIKKQYTNLLNNIDYIVIVIILCAGLLAFIVLYNLTNINITERIKEIATLKVLGFYDYEVSAYIYRETFILSIIGALTGLLCGVFLHSFVVKTAEVESMMFGRSIYPLSFIYSFSLTILFTIIVNLSMRKSLKNINMVESMKAND